MRLTLFAVGTSLLLAAAPAAAQQGAAAGMRVAPSGRATTQVTVSSRAPGDAGPTNLPVRIDYGQPHARGRDVAGGLIPYDQVWRTGANEATALVTDVDLEIGGLRVPKGSYTLYSLLTRTGWRLIVNRQTGQWGTQYDAAQDLGRVDMTLRRLPAPHESFHDDARPRGRRAARRLARADVGRRTGQRAVARAPARGRRRRGPLTRRTRRAA